MIAALHDLLDNEVLRRVLFRARFLLAFALLVPIGIYARPELLWLGFAVSMVGQAIQTWSFACLLKNLELTRHGPYLLVRNPMYLGRFLLMLGFVIVLGSWLAAAAFSVIYLLYVTSRVKREERRLQRVFGEEFERYCREVNRFLPSPRALGNPDLWYFSPARFRENNAHWNLLSTLLAYGVLVAVVVLLR